MHQEVQEGWVRDPGSSRPFPGKQAGMRLLLCSSVLARAELKAEAFGGCPALPLVHSIK